MPLGRSPPESDPVEEYDLEDLKFIGDRDGDLKLLAAEYAEMRREIEAIKLRLEELEAEG